MLVPDLSSDSAHSIANFSVFVREGGQGLDLYKFPPHTTPPLPRFDPSVGNAVEVSFAAFLEIRWGQQYDRSALGRYLPNLLFLLPPQPDSGSQRVNVGERRGRR